MNQGLKSTRCPCLSGLAYSECCAQIHRGLAQAPTAERLMRSRYSAFAVGDAAYLLHSWHPRTRPAVLELDADQRWFRLDILSTTRGTLLENEGTVEFRAFSKMSGDVVEQHEVSQFVKENGRWFYLAAAD
jgi:SEC-C motif-containing protein